MEGSGGYTKECKVKTTTSRFPRQSISYSLLVVPLVLLPLRLPAQPRFMHSSLFFLYRTIPSVCQRLQRIIIQSDIAPRLSLIVSRSHHVARETATPAARSYRDQLVKVRERRLGVLSLFVRGTRDGIESATIYEWSPGC